MTAEEKKEIAAKAKQAQMSLTDYLIECSRKTTIKVTDLSSILAELKRIGNNLNQIARKANSRKEFAPSQLIPLTNCRFDRLSKVLYSC